MIRLPTQKLSAGDNSYIRPVKTITESLSKEDIEEQLEGYVEIEGDDLNFININTSLKYLSYDKINKKELFRFGGLLVKIAKEYMILSGKGGKTFSVQRYTLNDKKEIIHITRFFKKIKESELLKSQLEDTADIVQKQTDIITKQKLELLALKKKLKNMSS